MGLVAALSKIVESLVEVVSIFFSVSTDFVSPLLQAVNDTRTMKPSNEARIKFDFLLSIYVGLRYNTTKKHFIFIAKQQKLIFKLMQQHPFPGLLMPDKGNNISTATLVHKP